MNTRHALIIDDDNKNVRVLAGLLEDEAFSSTLVTNPTLLPAVLAQLEAVDVVFLDLEMPGINGYQVLESLKANPKFSGVPIIAHTVHLSEMARTSQRGFDSFIGKPVNLEAFPGYMEQILSGNAVWESH